MVELKRNRLLLLMCFLAYSISYIGKYSYSTNIQNVITDFAISKAYAGYVTSAFFFCYGIGQLINGILCERLNSKWTITLSLCASAGITFAMFFLKNIFVMTVLWGLNGLILSTLWCHSVKLLATIRDKKQVAKTVTVMSITLPVGVVFSYGSSAAFTAFNFWKLTYLLSAGLLLVIGVFFFFVVGKVEEKPQENERGEVESSSRKEKQDKKNVLKVFGWLFIPIFLISVATGIIRDGASTWLPVILNDTYHTSDFVSILLTVGLPLMGVFAAMAATYLMEKTKNLFVCCVISGGAILLSMIVLAFAFETSVALLVGLFMILSLAGYILGNVFTSILPLYYKGQLKSGQTAGLTNACIYLGSTVSSFCLGGVVDEFGWQAFMSVFLVCAVVLVAMSLLGLLKRKKEK